MNSGRLGEQIKTDDVIKDGPATTRSFTDAAHKLGERGEETRVLVIDESGNARAAWTHGQDPYPPG
jgi:hypothetical protein